MIRIHPSILLLFLASAILMACGEPVVSIDQEQYDPKIVIDGYLFPGEPVEGIRITRNFALNTDIDVAEVALTGARVTLTDQSTGRIYELDYRDPERGFVYEGDDLSIESGRSYRLDVEAAVDGRSLEASAVTTVPGPGFAIDEEVSGPDSLIYLQGDDQDDLQHFEIAFQRATGPGFYVFSIRALDADRESFIRNNLFGVELEDLEEGDLEDLADDSVYRQHLLSEPGLSTVELFWSSFYFTGDYRIVAYAGDRNFEEFYLTFDSIQSDDGNLYEPRFNIEGDGIGVFGSAMVDTAYVRVVPTRE
jgi:hypothetical protein